MHNQEKLLGFDARKSRLDLKALWPKERQERYLIQELTSPIFSVDGMVWPSVFQNDPAVQGRTSPQQGPRDPVIPRAWIGPNKPYWQDLEELQECLAQLANGIPHWTIGVSLLLDNTPIPPGLYLEPTVPEKLENTWTFLGFDVADGGFISGLTNCGYDPAEMKEIKSAGWVQNLNEHHLLKDLEAAKAARLACNSRIPEHAPFFAFGLWLIAKSDPSAK